MDRHSICAMMRASLEEHVGSRPPDPYDLLLIHAIEFLENDTSITMLVLVKIAVLFEAGLVLANYLAAQSRKDMNGS